MKPAASEAQVRIVCFVVPLIVPSLKNSNGMNRYGQRFDNGPVKAYKRQFGLFVPAEYRNLSMGGPKNLLKLSVKLYHDSWRRDADIAIIPDCLQTAGVIGNDRWIRIIEVDASLIDPDNPRAEIILTEL